MRVGPRLQLNEDSKVIIFHYLMQLSARQITRAILTCSVFICEPMSDIRLHRYWR
jgi:hypothetical protein